MNTPKLISALVETRQMLDGVVALGRCVSLTLFVHDRPDVAAEVRAWAVARPDVHLVDMSTCNGFSLLHAGRIFCEVYTVDIVAKYREAKHTTHDEQMEAGHA